MNRTSGWQKVPVKIVWSGRPGVGEERKGIPSHVLGMGMEGRKGKGTTGVAAKTMCPNVIIKEGTGCRQARLPNRPCRFRYLEQSLGDEDESAGQRISCLALPSHGVSSQVFG
jgi:hypothetical protein